jgi:acetoin utilization deacetylase AcuC-like enzyme
MKPHRLTLVNALMIGYGLDKQIQQIYNPPPASREELLGYHDKEYIDFLSRYVAFRPVSQADSELKEGISVVRNGSIQGHSP